MKKIVLSAVAVLAMSSFAVAGGDIAPIPAAEPMEVGDFYVGLSYSCLDARQTDGDRINTSINEDFEAVMLQAGYGINEYIAIEARWWIGLDEAIVVNDMLTTDSNIDIWGIYAKPMYPVTEDINVYGLLGYASASYDVSPMSLEDADGFSWGAGLEYTFSNNIKLFADYVSIYEDSQRYTDDSINTYNFGVGYRF
jgi:opacity protein-like surface antigen